MKTSPLALFAALALLAAPLLAQAQTVYPVTTTAFGGEVACTPDPVPHGQALTCTASPIGMRRFQSWGDHCAGQTGTTCTLPYVTQAPVVSAVFLDNATALPLPEGPHQGRLLDVTLAPGNHWQLQAVAAQTAASLPALPPGVSLPHGAVHLALGLGNAGSSATVVLTYPEALPEGTVYYKYGPTKADPQPHWYPFGAARIQGHTITLTLTLTDGEDGDDDLDRNGGITDPGGPALLSLPPAGAQAIPTLGEWGVLLLSALAALAAWPGLRRRQAKTAANR